LIICRKATVKELTILKKYYDDQLQLFQQKKLDAKKTLKVGEYPLNGEANPDILAAMMKVANMIYNMEEAITKT
jgi:hypothetical protein